MDPITRTGAIFGLVLIAVSGVLLAAAGTAHACQCIERPVAQARDAAAIVFEGVLVDHVDARDERSGVATFRVDRVWKGDVTTRRVTVATDGSSTMCPPHFAIGRRYIVYADGSLRDARVRQCARYAFDRTLDRERRALGRPARSFVPPRRARRGRSR